MIISCVVAPLALAAILGFAFGSGGGDGPLPLGVSGASPALLRAAVQSMQAPERVSVRTIASAGKLRSEVADGTLAAGVVVSRPHERLSDLMIPILSPGATHSPGFDLVSRASSLVGQEWAESLAASLAARTYAGRIGTGPATEPAAVAISTQSLGNAAKGVLDYFAPSIAVIFLFIGSGLGMRSLMLERSGGTLVRLAAAPVRSPQIVAGKMLAILITGLTSILVVWGATTALFGADWGDPLGVLIMCVGATLAMCGLGAFLTSLARDEQQAFGIALIVGLVLSLLGGNLLPPGSLPEAFQVLSLGTPNGWALVGFGRLSLLGEPASAVIGPFLVLCLIAAVSGGLAMTRIRRMVSV
jgi:ABC-2 type transport system permease protein